MIFVPKEGMPPAMLDRLLRLAAFQNPEFYRTQAVRLPVWDKPRVISCGEDFAKHIALPRGCLQEIEQLLQAHEFSSPLRTNEILVDPSRLPLWGNCERIRRR